MQSEAARRRVLIVEDEPLIALLFEEGLADLQCKCVGPYMRLQEALTAAAIEAIDAAVLDVSIGGSKSLEVADVLERRGIPFGFSSGYPNSVLGEKWRSRPYLNKPFSFDELSRLLALLIPPVA